MRISNFKKFVLLTALFAFVLYKNVNSFVQSRPLTLYDHLGIDRSASFDEIKQARDLYL